jgi:hypothetical protein
MSYQTIDSIEVVQVYSPTLVSDALLVTIRSFPSGSVLLRTVPQDIFTTGGTSPILASLSNAVENILDGGLATAAQGTQGIDDSGLLFDAVVFTVTYTPSTPIPGTLTATVEIPVDTITADTSFGSFLTGGSAEDQLQATYDRLAAMSSG